MYCIPNNAKVCTRRITCKNAACRPHINTGSVEFGPEKYVWGPIPEGDHLCGKTPDRDAKGSRQPKVRKFQFASLVDQQVLGFQIPMENIPAVAVGQAPQQLIPGEVDSKCFTLVRCLQRILHERLDDVGVDVTVEGVKVLFEVLVAVLKHQSQLAV